MIYTLTRMCLCSNMQLQTHPDCWREMQIRELGGRWYTLNLVSYWSNNWLVEIEDPQFQGHWGAIIAGKCLGYLYPRAAETRRHIDCTIASCVLLETTWSIFTHARSRPCRGVGFKTEKWIVDSSRGCLANEPLKRLAWVSRMHSHRIFEHHAR